MARTLAETPRPLPRHPVQLALSAALVAAWLLFLAALAATA